MWRRHDASARCLVEDVVQTFRISTGLQKQAIRGCECSSAEEVGPVARGKWGFSDGGEEESSSGCAIAGACESPLNPECFREESAAKRVRQRGFAAMFAVEGDCVGGDAEGLGHTAAFVFGVAAGHISGAYQAAIVRERAKPVVAILTDAEGFVDVAGAFVGLAWKSDAG